MPISHPIQPHHIRQAILGCIAATPIGGITTTTIITLTHTQTHPPKRIQQLLRKYEQDKWITQNPPDVWHPTPRLHTRIQTWRPHPQPPTPKPAPHPTHWRTQHAILNDYLHTRRTYRTIAQHNGVTHQQAWDIIHTHLDHDEIRVRDNDRKPRKRKQP